MRISLLAVPVALAVLGLSACAPTEDSAPTPHTYQLGERVPLGHLIYTVFDRQWLTQIGDGVDARIPQGRFYQIRLAVLNSGGSSMIIPAVAVVDDAGKEYNEIENGDGIQDFMGALREVAPAESAQGVLVFDVQPKHYKLKLSDEDGKTFAMVDLPLSFDSDAPDVVTPLDSVHPNDATKK